MLGCDTLDEAQVASCVPLASSSPTCTCPTCNMPLIMQDSTSSAPAWQEHLWVQHKTHPCVQQKGLELTLRRCHPPQAVGLGLHWQPHPWLKMVLHLLLLLRHPGRTQHQKTQLGHCVSQPNMTAHEGFRQQGHPACPACPEGPASTSTSPPHICHAARRPTGDSR